jgi:hypothetical protein
VQATPSNDLDADYTPRYIWLAKLLRGYIKRHWALATATPPPLGQGRALEGRGRCHLLDRERNEQAAALLRQAQAVYRAINSAGEQRIIAMLDSENL